jgi:hypothetical protein
MFISTRRKYQFLTRKSSGGHQAKRRKEGKIFLSPRNRKACHNVGTALLKSVAEMGTQSAMKSSRKTLHELSPHIPQKTPKRSISSWTTRRKYATINSEWKY